jgi:hypothetical protein
MKIDGQCHCGAIAYRAEVDPNTLSICHCSDCQTLSGSPFRASIPASAASFDMLRGKVTVYVKTADSGARRRQAFCAICGTPIYACEDEDNPQTYSLRAGAIAQRASFRPKLQIWCRSAMPWVDSIAAVPARDS